MNNILIRNCARSHYKILRKSWRPKTKTKKQTTRRPVLTEDRLSTNRHLVIFE